MEKPSIAITDVAALPVVPIRGLVLFPSITAHFDVRRDISLAALKYALSDNQLVWIALQKNPQVETPGFADLESIGVICRVKQLTKSGGAADHVLVDVLCRARLSGAIQEEPFLMGLVVEEDSHCDASHTDAEWEAMRRQTLSALRTYLSVQGKTLPELPDISDPSAFAFRACAQVQLPPEKGQPILACADPYERLLLLLTFLTAETEIIELERRLSIKVKQQLDQNQREYVLREQMKAIQEELGDKDGTEQEIKEFREKLAALSLPEEAAKRCERELDRLQKLSFSHPEAGTIRNYLTWMCDLPWGKRSDEQVDLARAERILNRDHHGLTKVKNRILEYLAVRKLTNQLAGPILCLVGPPGVGKTSIARSVAESLGRTYVRISLGGVRDEADIRGHRVTYIGALPGRIITGMKQAGTGNPLMLLDEIDKLTADAHGDPASALLEVLDSEQNSHFHDHYLGVEYDLSDVLFIATANTLDHIPRPLLDRMEVISLEGYTHAEKYQIARRHLLPRQLMRHGIGQGMLTLSPGALHAIIDGYTREAGVRGLERRLGDICRKAARQIVANEKPCAVTVKNLEEYLGPRKYRPIQPDRKGAVGVATGLAWTQVGGDVLAVEASVMKGRGHLELTGQLGDVMKESAQAAVSYLRSNAARFGVAEDFYRRFDLHIHVPEGATPKDGPSAGITITTALASALSGRRVRGNVAMTGEITLRGRVLPIGGLKEKAMAAARSGIQTVIIPQENVPDLEELDREVRDGLTFLPVSCVDEVLTIALEK